MEGSPGTRSWRCAADALQPGQTARFQLERDGKTVAGFIVDHERHPYAYVNRCPHAGTPLDWWPNEFFTEDGRYLICATHGRCSALTPVSASTGPAPARDWSGSASSGTASPWW